MKKKFDIKQNYIYGQVQLLFATEPKNLIVQYEWLSHLFKFIYFLNNFVYFFEATFCRSLNNGTWFFNILYNNDLICASYIISVENFFHKLGLDRTIEPIILMRTSWSFAFASYNTYGYRFALFYWPKNPVYSNMVILGNILLMSKQYRPNNFRVCWFDKQPKKLLTLCLCWSHCGNKRSNHIIIF